MEVILQQEMEELYQRKWEDVYYLGHSVEGNFMLTLQKKKCGKCVLLNSVEGKQHREDNYEFFTCHVFSIILVDIFAQNKDALVVFFVAIMNKRNEHSS